MATNLVTFDGQQYDLNDPVQMQAYLAAMGHAMIQQQNTIQQQAQHIQTMQTAPGLNNQQFQTLINALTPAATRVQAVRNPVLSTATRTVNYEEHPVPAGIEDIKGLELPDSFNGRKSDALNFIVRMKAYFSAKPKNMKYTKTRILTTCDLLKHETTRPWSDAVRKAIATETNGEYYYDSWAAFEAEFLKRYGFTDSKQHFFRQMTRYTQYQKQDCKAYADEFERLRQEAGQDKAAAFQYLKQGTLPLFRTRLIFRENPPNDYDAWATALKKMQEQMDQEREFRYHGNQVYQPQRYQSQRYPTTTQRPSVASGPAKPTGYGDPMDIDVMKTKRMQAKKPSVTGPRKVPTQPAKRTTAPHPTPPPAYQSAKPQASSSKPKLTGKSFRCYICNGEGHYARDCRAQINELDVQHIRYMGQVMEETLQYHESINGEEEEMEMMFEPAYEEEEDDEDGDLITFQDELSPNEETGFTQEQGF
jgi:hypothetical protein